MEESRLNPGASKRQRTNSDSGADDSGDSGCGDSDKDDEGEFLDLQFDDDGRIMGPGLAGLDFSTRTFSELVRSPTLVQALQREAEALDALDRSLEGEDQSLDASFWLPAALIGNLPAYHHASDQSSSGSLLPLNGLSLLERAALEVFRLHTKDCHGYDPSTSGAEWWVQVRHADDSSGTNYEDRVKAGPKDQDESIGPNIQFHFDKDETLQASFLVHACPHVSTVTYLTGSGRSGGGHGGSNPAGAPTLVLNQTCAPDGAVVPVPSTLPRANAASAAAGDEIAAAAPGEQILSPGIASGFLSFPRAGKHLVFDGRLLHGVPADLAAIDPGGAPPASTSAQQPLAPRVTLLVNVWLGHQPIGIEPLERSVAAVIVSRSGGGGGGGGEKLAPEAENMVEKAGLLLRRDPKPDVVSSAHVASGREGESTGSNLPEVTTVEYLLRSAAHGPCLLRCLLPVSAAALSQCIAGASSSGASSSQPALLTPFASTGSVALQFAPGAEASIMQLPDQDEESFSSATAPVTTQEGREVEG